MRQPRSQSWSVEVSSRAWEQLGVVPSDVFRQIKRELDAVAELATQQMIEVTGSRIGHSFSLKVGGYAALYRLDPEESVVLLEEVTKRLDTTPDPIPTPRPKRKKPTT